MDKNALIKEALSAAPPAIAKAATVLDGDGSVLKKGSGAYTCYPTLPLLRGKGHEPMCLDKVWLEWHHAWMERKDFKPKALGIAYMLAGDSGASNIDPFADQPTKDNQWVVEGPHVMVIVLSLLCSAIFGKSLSCVRESLAMALRIAFYSSHVPASAPEPSGDRTQARSLIAALEEEGHLVQVMSEFPAKFFWLHWQQLRALPLTLVRTWAQTRAFRPDVWLTLGSERDVPDVLGPLIARLARIPYVIYKAPHKNWHGRRKPGQPAGNWWRLPGHVMNRIAIRRARNVIVNKHSDFELYRQNPRVRSKLSLLLPAVSTADFKPDPPARARTRLALTIPDDRCVVLSASRLWDRAGRKEKSVRFLIDCISELLASGSKVHLVVAGDGSSRTALERHAQRLGACCTFLGSVDAANMAPLYNAADIFAYPGLDEHIGIVYLEAQACGTPVVAFASGGIPTVVVHGKTGLLTEPLDMDTYLTALRRLIDSPSLRSTMGQAGVEHVRMHHRRSDWGRRISAVLEAATSPASPERRLV